jgi:GNAT superfamily N-acetyltransferase
MPTDPMLAATARATTTDDIPALCALQARIIAIGGTTAHEVPLTEAEFALDYLTGPDAVCCHTAILGGRAVGFQAVGLHPDLPQGWGDIGTFVDADLQRSGAGQALFAATRAAARMAGIVTLNATIRADNVPGLAYYARIGFRDYGADPHYALSTGRVVGRVHRRYDL